MKQVLFFIVTAMLLIFWPDKINAQTIVFSYDEGGKMTERKVQVFPGARLAGRFTNDSIIIPNLVNFNIFPNPTYDYLNIEGELPENASSAQVNILNIGGQVLKTDVYSGQSKQILVSDLAKGMYVLEIRYSKKEKSTYKIIIN